MCLVYFSSWFISFFTIASCIRLYQAKILCSNNCKCVGCKNFEESPERKTLMHLADAAEVRVQQQTDANTKLQFQDFPSRPATVNDSGERYDALILIIIICSSCIALYPLSSNGDFSGLCTVNVRKRKLFVFTDHTEKTMTKNLDINCPISSFLNLNMKGNSMSKTIKFFYILL